MSYVGRHWRGELSLVTSYWINGVLVCGLLRGAASAIYTVISEKASLNTAITLYYVLIAAWICIGIWGAVGIWRSATNTNRRSGHYFWPAVAKGFVVLGLLAAVGNVSTTLTDLSRFREALKAPEFSQYKVTRLGETDLIFWGAINDESVQEVMSALGDPTISLLRIDSLGGLTVPAGKLGRYVRQRSLMVMAERQCVSACVIVLAGSPFAAVLEGSVIAFHRPQAVVRFDNPDFMQESEAALRETDKIFEEFGIASWAIQRARSHEYWYPTLAELRDMGLIKGVYEIEAKRFVAVRDYCAVNSSKCN